MARYVQIRRRGPTPLRVPGFLVEIREPCSPLRKWKTFPDIASALDFLLGCEGEAVLHADL